jgi:hypothetical protein
MSLQQITTTIETFVDIMASTLIFSVSEDEILIHEVQNNTLLYNIGDPNYKNIIQKDARIKISSGFNNSECQLHTLLNVDFELGMSWS